MNELEFVRQMYLWLGIKLCNKSVTICNRKILQELELRMVFFPICLHSTAIFLQLITITDIAKFKAYDMFLNTLLICLPCALWWSLFKNRNSIRFQILIANQKETQTLKEFIYILYCFHYILVFFHGFFNYYCSNTM